MSPRAREFAAPDRLNVLLSHAKGQLILLVAFGLWVIGAVWVLRLIKPKG